MLIAQEPDKWELAEYDSKHGFYDAMTVGFEIAYPDSWEAVPAQWMKQFLGRGKNTSAKIAEAISDASAPFLVVHDPACGFGVSAPAVKCKAYNLASVESGGGMHKLLSAMEQWGKQIAPDFEVLEYVPQLLFARSLGAKIVTAMSVTNLEGEWFHTITEVFYLPASRYLFSVAISGTSDPTRRPENAFSEIKKSIRLR